MEISLEKVRKIKQNLNNYLPEDNTVSYKQESNSSALSLSDVQRIRKQIDTPQVKAPVFKDPSKERDKNGFTTQDISDAIDMIRGKKVSPLTEPAEITSARKQNEANKAAVNTKLSDLYDDRFNRNVMRKLTGDTAAWDDPYKLSAKKNEIAEQQAALKPSYIGSYDSDAYPVAMPKMEVSPYSLKKINALKQEAAKADLDKSLEEERAYAKEHPAAAIMGSIANEFAGSISGPAKILAESVRQNDVDYRASGGGDGVYGSGPSRRAEAARQGAGEGIKAALGITDFDQYGNRKLSSQAVDFGVGVGSSILSTLTRTMLGPIGGLQSGASAFTSAYSEAKDRGADNDTALMRGISQGLAEWYFENHILQNLEALKAQPVSSTKVFLKNTLKNMASEAKEEGLTTISNKITDSMIMGGLSDFNIAKNNYLSAGMTENEAYANAWRDTIGEIFQDALAGAVSGGILGAAEQGTQAKVNAEIGKTIGATDIAEMNAALNKAEQTQDISSAIAENLKLSQKIEEGKASNMEKGAAVQRYNEATDSSYEYERLEKYMRNFAGEGTKAALANGLMNTSYDTQADFLEQFTSVYNAGKNGTGTSGLDTSLLNADQIEAAFKGGVDASNEERFETRKAQMFLPEYAVKSYEENYDGKLDKDVYTKGYVANYLSGRFGVDLNDLGSAESSMLTDKQRNAAFLSGEAEKKSAAERYTVKKAAAGINTGITSDNIAPAVRDAINAFGKAAGLNAAVTENLTIDGTKIRLNGLSNRKDGSVVFDMDASSGTGFHEAVHSMSVLAPEQYNDVAASAVAALAKDQGYDSVVSYIQHKADQYKKAGTLKSLDDIVEEIASQAAESLADTKFRDQFIEAHPEAAGKLSKFIRSIADLLNRIFDHFKDNFVSRSVKNRAEEYLKIADAVDRGLEKMRSINSGDDNINVSDDNVGKMFSINPNYVKKIDEWDGKTRGLVFKLGKTSSALQSIDIDEKVIVMRSGKMIQIMKDHPEIVKDSFKQIPYVLENPIIIMQSKTVGGRITILGEGFAENKKPIMIVLELQPEINGVLDLTKIIVVNSYVKDDTQELINTSEIKYVEPIKKRTMSWLERTGLQLPRLQSYGPISKVILADKDGFVKYEGQENSKIGLNAFNNAFKKAGIIDENGKQMFSIKEPVEETKDLIAVHNLTANKLIKTLEYEGFPMPSIAVTKKDIGHKNFGDITLVFDKSTIDPKNRKNRVYGSDAWTPTFPRIDYDLDENKMNLLRRMSYSSRDMYPDHFRNDFVNFIGNLESKIAYEGVQKGVIDSAKDNYGVKAAYLASEGNKIETAYKENVIEMDDKLKDFSKWLIDNFDIDSVANENLDDLFSDGTIKKIIDHFNEVTGKSLNLENRFFIQRILRNRLETAFDYRENGGRRTEQVEDYDAEKKFIDEKIDEKAYDKWLNGMFSDIVSDTGISNNKDIFTASGNRKSFKQTHFAVTAKNIVKSMLGQAADAKNVSGYHGLHSIRASATPEFKSINDIKKSSGRLQNLESELYKTMEDDLSKRLDLIMNEILGQSKNSSDNAFIDLDHIGECIIEACQNPSADNVYKILNKYRWKTTMEQAQDISDIIHDVIDMPVNMFEAKPERVVDFGEVKLAVVPDDTDPSVIQKMKDAGITNIRTYEAGNEEARKLEVNDNSADYMFSIMDDEINDVRALEEDNEVLAKYNDEMDAIYGEAKGHEISDDLIEKVVRRTIRANGSTIDYKEITPQVRKMYEYLSNAGRKNARELGSVARTLGMSILDNATERKSVLQEMYPDLKAEMKATKLTMTPVLKAEMKNLYDSFGNFRKRTFGYLNLVNEGNGGINVDMAYMELSDKYPELFPADITNMQDQLVRMAEVAEKLKPTNAHITESMGDEDYETAAYVIGQELLAGYFEGEARGNYTAKLENMKRDLKAKYQHELKLAKDAQQEEIDKLKKRYDELRKASIEDANKNSKERRELEKMKKQLDQMIKDEPATIQQIKDSYEKRIERADMKRFTREARARLLRNARQLKSMKGDPYFNEMRDKLIGDLDLISTGIRKDTALKLEQLREYALQQAELSDDYRLQEYPKASKLFDRLGKRHISEMSADEIEELTHAIVALKYDQYAYNRTLRDDLGQKIATLGRKAVAQQRDVKGINARNEILSALGKYALYMENPTRAAKMLDGYKKDGIITMLANGLNEGQEKADRFVMESKQLFNDALTDKELIDTWSDPNIEITDAAGKTHKISKGMRIAIYLNSLCWGNREHINYGGLIIPDEELYRKGMYKEAYNMNDRAVFKPTDLKKIIDEMTPAELAFANAAHEFFNTKTKDAINETSLTLNGYEKAIVDDYYPIKTAPDFTKKDVSGLINDLTIEGQGFTKERNEYAKNPILLEDVAQVIQRQIDGVSKYYGLAVPVRDFNKVYNYTSTGFEDSTKSAISKTWQTPGKTYIENMLRDIQLGGRTSDSGIFDLLKSKYAGSVLNLNPGVAIKQTASYPFALTVLDAKALAAGLTKDILKADRDYMDSITPYSWMRRQGMSGTELGEVYKQRGIIEKNGTLQKIRKATNWIQMVDVWTTDRLFTATEEYVKAHNPSLTVRGEEYNKKVADLYREVLQRTQPSYNVMQRNEYLRNQDTALKALTAFKTQTFNMGGELIDAWSEWRAYEDYKKKGQKVDTELKNAKQRFMRTVGSTMISQAALVILSAVAKAALHQMRPYRDENGEVTAQSVLGKVGVDFLESFGGMVLGGSELQTGILASLNALGLIDTGDRYYDITLPAFDTINDFASSITSWCGSLRNYLEDKSESSTEALAKKTANLSIKAAQTFGIPANNVYNMLNAFKLWGDDFKNSEVGTFEAGKGILGITDTSNTDTTYYKRMFDRLYKDHDWNGFIKEFNREAAKKGQKIVEAKLSQMLQETPEVKAAAAAKAAGDPETEKEEKAKLGAWAVGDGYLAPIVEKAVASQAKKLEPKEVVQEEEQGWDGESQIGERSKGAQDFVDAGGDIADYDVYKAHLDSIKGDGTSGSRQKQIASYIRSLGLPKDQKMALWTASGQSEKSYDKFF